MPYKEPARPPQERVNRIPTWAYGKGLPEASAGLHRERYTHIHSDTSSSHTAGSESKYTSQSQFKQAARARRFRPCREALSNPALPGSRVLLLLSLLPTATGHRDSRVQPRRYCRVHRYKHLPTATKPSQSRPAEPDPSRLGPRGRLDFFGTRPSETERLTNHIPAAAGARGPGIHGGLPAWNIVSPGTFPTLWW